MNIKESGILQYFYTDAENNYGIDFYSDAECTESLTYSYSNNFVIIPKAGTYYVKVSNLYADTSVVNSLAISFQLYSNSNPTLKANQWKATGLMDYTKPVYYKFNVAKTGLVKVDFEAENTNSYVALCSSSKKALTDDTTVTGTTGVKVFALTKGTYYIRVTSNAYWARIKVTQKSISDASGSSKTKASTLKIGTAKNGYLLLKDKTSSSDWYKFTLTKPQKVNLIVSGNVSSGYINYELSSPSISGSLSGYLSDVGDVDTTKLIYQVGKKVYYELPKGTYYIRVYKSSADTCGNYSVKVVNR
jgi:hypothetical protein